VFVNLKNPVILLAENVPRDLYFKFVLTQDVRIGTAASIFYVMLPASPSLPYRWKLWQGKNLAITSQIAIGEINFGKFKSSTYCYFSCYGQLACKTLVNS